jgi:hypothetical protein
VSGTDQPGPDVGGPDVDGSAGASWHDLDDDPRLQAGVAHLQRAAHELIAASRAVLDVAEELIDSPGGVGRIVGILGELGEVASRVAGSTPSPTAADDDPEPPVQRIPVS